MVHCMCIYVHCVWYIACVYMFTVYGTLHVYTCMFTVYGTLHVYGWHIFFKLISSNVHAHVHVAKALLTCTYRAVFLGL